MCVETRNRERRASGFAMRMNDQTSGRRNLEAGATPIRSAARRPNPNATRLICALLPSRSPSTARASSPRLARAPRFSFYPLPMPAFALLSLVRRSPVALTTRTLSARSPAHSKVLNSIRVSGAGESRVCDLSLATCFIKASEKKLEKKPKTHPLGAQPPFSRDAFFLATVKKTRFLLGWLFSINRPDHFVLRGARYH